MNKYLVIGANGFIGKTLTNKLISTGNEVIAIDLKLPDNEQLLKSAEWIKADASDWNFMIDNIFHRKYKWDGIFNFGSPSSIIEFNKKPFESVRTTLYVHENCIAAASNSNCKYVYPSSGNIYGPVEEQAEYNIVKPSNLYALTKQMCENIAFCKTSFVGSSGNKAIGLRIFAGYGPGEELKGDIASVVTLFLNDMIQGKSPVIWGDGEQTRDFIYIDDVIDGIIAAYHSHSSGIVNLGTGVSTSFNTLLSTINKHLGTNIEATYVPKPSSYVEKTKADISKMKSILGIKPRSLDDGIKSLITYRQTIDIKKLTDV